MSIRSKIICTVLLVAVISLSLLIGITMISMNSLKNDVVNLSDTLGTTAGIDSHEALEKQILAHLGDLANSKAELIDEKMSKKQQEVEITVKYISDIYKNPDTYKPQNINPPDPSLAGVVSAQILYAPNVDPISVAKEVGLAANVADFLLLFPGNGTDIDANYYSSKNGFFIVTDDIADLKDKTVETRDRVWYKNAVESERLIWTDVFDDVYGRGLAITCSAPVFGVNNEFAGVIGFGTLLTTLNQNIVETKIGETGYAFIINEFGDTIISPHIKKDDKGKIIRRNLRDIDAPDFQDVAKRIMARESGVTQVTLEGRQVYMAYYPMNVLPWSVVTVIDVEEAIRPAYNNQNKITALTDDTIKGIDNSIFESCIAIFIVVCGAIVLVIASSIVLGDLLTRPLEKLTKGVRRISGGDLNSFLEVSTKDEIGTLANSFNMMLCNLNLYIKDLTVITAEKERIGAELDVARHIQASMLPCIFPAFPDKNEFDIFALMHPAKEVGGDFYDFFLIDETHLAIAIADVSGKGVPAALFMVIAKTLIKNHVQASESPADVFTNTNRQLCENNDADMFVTAWMGVLELSTGKFIYVNAGHNPPLLKRANGQFEYLRSRGSFVLAGMDGITYKQNEIYLNKDDVLFLYTDGVTEATNTQNELYSEQRLINLLNTKARTNPEQILNTVSIDIDDFVKTAPQFDDITMLAIKINKVENGTIENAKTISVPATIDEVQNVTKFVNTCLDEYGVSLKTKRKFAIVIDEICSNTVKFTYQGNTGKMTVSCAYDKKKNTLQLIFMDTGLAYNPLEAQEPDTTLSVEERKIGGLGLFMVKKIMDNVTYEYKNSTNILIIEKQNVLSYEC